MYPHLRSEEVRAFVRGNVPQGRSVELAVHLLGCPSCARVFHLRHPGSGAARLGECLGLPGPAPLRPSEVSRCALEIAEHDEGPMLWEGLHHLPTAEKSLRVRNLPREQVTPGLIIAILGESRQQWHESATAAAELARLALDLLDEFEKDEFPFPSLLGDLRAQGLGYLGNAERIQGDLRGAERKLRTAVAVVLIAGTRELGLMGTLLRLWAKVRRDAEDFSQARSLYGLAETCFGLRQDTEWLGILRLDRARLLAEEGCVAEASSQLDALIQSEEFTRMSYLAQLSATQSLVSYLCDLGRFFEAGKLLREVENLAAIVGGDLNQLKIHWVRARVSAGTKSARVAEAQYLEIRDRLVDLGHTMDAALVTLELAELYLAWGRPRTARAQAAVALEVCRSVEGMRREEIEALATMMTAEKDCVGRTIEAIRTALRSVRRPADTVC